MWRHPGRHRLPGSAGAEQERREHPGDRGVFMKIVVGINGAAGRMGQRLAHLSQEDKELALGVALESPSHPLLSRDIGEVCGLGRLGVALRSDVPDSQILDVLLDFSTPEGTMNVLPLCKARRIPLVEATTAHRAA